MLVGPVRARYANPAVGPKTRHNLAAADGIGPGMGPALAVRSSHTSAGRLRPFRRPCLSCPSPVALRLRRAADYFALPAKHSDSPKKLKRF